MSQHQQFLREAVRLAQANRARGGQPFGAVMTLAGQVVATGVNDIAHSHDPTTHAEMEAVRAACRRLGRPLLAGSLMYASGYPCPMCLAAMLGAGVQTVYYAFGNEDGAPWGMSAEPAYRALGLPVLPQPLPMIQLDTGVTAAQLYGGG